MHKEADTIRQLANWYSAQCNDNWEHTYGIKIETLDNPGWRLLIDLIDTQLEDKTFTVFERGDPDKGETDWVFCKVEGGKFVAGGGVNNLPELIKVFVSWTRE